MLESNSGESQHNHEGIYPFSAFFSLYEMVRALSDSRINPTIVLITEKIQP